MGLISSIKKKVGEVVDGFKEKAEVKKDKKEKEEKLRKWQDKFASAKANYDTSIMDDRELMYGGKRETDIDINDPGKKRKKANNIVNIIYEFVESQIDTTIPQPAITSKRKGFESHASIIEDSIKNHLLDSEIYRINDENERTTPIQGYSIITVSWNPEFKHHLYRGEIELENQHPKTLIPQPGVFNLQKMDYYFLMSSQTKEYVKKRYKVDVSKEEESEPGINSIDNQDNPDNNTDNVTVITVWYKDENDDICKFTWCNDNILEDMPKFFYRRDETGNILEYEILDRDIITPNGNIIPALSPVIDDMGMPVIDEFGNPTMEPTKIRYYVPNRYPIAIRKNVPVAFNFGGQSDIDAIRDQADSIKKVITRIEKKILESGAILKWPKNQVEEFTQNIWRIVKGDRADLQSIEMMNVQSDIQQDLLFAQEQYKAAQNTLGITDSFQGKPDPTATSGVAKQIQVYQATGRMQSKQFNKRAVYKELFEIMFEFQLAFYDETRPYTRKGANNQPVYGEFNKYDFLIKDEAGEWYYNTDFLFTADAGDGLPKDKLWLMQETKAAATAGLIDKVQYWTIMEKLGFPNANDIKEQAIQEQQAMIQQQQAMQ